MPRPESPLSITISPRLKWTGYIHHDPTPKQQAFLLLESEEAFYGGAAGGGKSDALLMAALQYVDIPSYAAIIFRKTYADLALPGALLDRSREWLSSTDAHWKDQEKTWVFPSGATLTFGYLENDNDHFRYQGAEFQFVGFDEVTQHKEFQYRYLFSRLRRLKDSSIPLRMRSASNPGGIGHDWVKQRFITDGLSQRRVFIPATLDDNPHLDRESYIKSLSNLDPVTRQQLLNGDWSARTAGNKFKREWFSIVEVEPADIQWVRYWDMAATEARSNNDPDWTAGSKVGRNKQGNFFIADIRHVRSTPQQVEALIKQTADLDGRNVRIFLEQEPGSSGKSIIDYYTRQVLAGFAFHPDRVSSNKVLRADPLSSQAEAGNIKLVRGSWINAFLDEAEAFPNGSHDDQVDAVSGALNILTRTGTAEIKWI